MSERGRSTVAETSFWAPMIQCGALSNMNVRDKSAASHVVKTDIQTQHDAIKTRTEQLEYERNKDQHRKAV